MFTSHLISILLMPMSAAPSAELTASTWRVYVGTMTHGGSKGIYLFTLDAASGQLTPHGLACETDNPAFLAVHPEKPYLYAVGEKSTGTVSAFQIDRETGRLSLLNTVGSKGEGPCHLAVAPSGRDVAIANYNSGSTALLPILSDGRLGDVSHFFQHEGKSVNPHRQEGPHAHGVTFDKAGRFLFVPDLGTDRVAIYQYHESTQELAKNDPASVSVAPGAGPRHIAFHPSGRYAYVVNEMGNTVTMFNYDPASGRMTSSQTIGTLPADFTKESTTAEIEAHPSGRFVYASNRGHDSITSFSVAQDTGRLTLSGVALTGGKTPRSFCLDPAGRYLVAGNQDSGDLAVFRVNPESGVLEATGQRLKVANPVCVLIVKP